MVEWINVETPKIQKIGYNSEINIMYIDFSGSTFDMPFKGVSEDDFREFGQATDVDEHYETHIKNQFIEVEIDTENNINVGMKQGQYF